MPTTRRLGLVHTLFMFPLVLMNSFSAKLGVTNSRKTPLVVLVEPWAFDYTLMPTEELEVVAYDQTKTPTFHVVELETAVQIYCEADNFDVMQGDRELAIGHQRQD